MQHAELKPQAAQLDRLAFHPGQLLQPLSQAEFVDAERGNFRLRELVLQQYLFEVDNGWVLDRAQFYRGARQIEDEERKGRVLLEALLADSTWVKGHYLLANRLVATVPHAGTATERGTERVRNLATEIAELDNRFFDTRIKIHSFPSATDTAAVAAFNRRRDLSRDVKSRVEDLLGLLRTQYSTDRVAQVLRSYGPRIPPGIKPAYQLLAQDAVSSDPNVALGALGELLAEIRKYVSTAAVGAENLLLFDLAQALQERAFVLAQSAPSARATRDSSLDRFMVLANLAYGSGFLTARERDALGQEVRSLRQTSPLGALDYRNSLSNLARGLDWGWGTARATFGPIQDYYVAVEPKAAGFLDAVVRSSILLPLSRELDPLVADADAILEAPHRVLGATVTQGVRGLNPGLALRRLALSDAEGMEHAERDRVYVIPGTTPELKPVAGVLTLDEGNLLSHVQLLARNLGIPNAVVSSELLPRLRPAEGEEVLYAVSPLGRVLLERPDALVGDERALIEATRVKAPPRIRLDTSRLKLERWQPIYMDSLRTSISGVWVGPKAANLGELAHTFPDHVSRGLALPFGMFVRHANRSLEPGQPTVLARLRSAYDEASMRAERGDSEASVDAFMVERLAVARRSIEELPWDPEVRRAIEQAVRNTFGGEPTGGVFVRSDTNVEDLPQFSGAGLNLTVAHRRSVEDILSSVKRVWTSPFTERAYLWRKQILEEQGEVYPSVLLLESIHSDRSGVLITSGLQFGGEEAVTVVAAEGVGGGVEGEEAETVVVRRDGSGQRLLSQAKAPRRRALIDTGAGGTEWRVATLPETLLSENDVDALMSVVAEWESHVPEDQTDEIWDMEYGFHNDKLWLFQVRPFVRFRNSDLMTTLSILDRQAIANGGRPVDLSGRLVTTSAPGRSR